jgi:hypothetical protein
MTPKKTDPVSPDDVQLPDLSDPGPLESAKGLTIIDPPGMERYRINGQLWHGTIDFIAAIPDTTVWRNVPGNPESTERIRARFHADIMKVTPDLRLFERGVGALLTGEDVAAMMQISIDDVKKLARNGRLLVVREPGLPAGHPHIQFDWDGNILPGLTPILKVLKPWLSPREIARWIATPHFTRRSPATLMYTGDPDVALAFARDLANCIRTARSGPGDRDE